MQACQQAENQPVIHGKLVAGHSSRADMQCAAMIARFTQESMQQSWSSGT